MTFTMKTFEKFTCLFLKFCYTYAIVTIKWLFSGYVEAILKLYKSYFITFFIIKIGYSNIIIKIIYLKRKFSIFMLISLNKYFKGEIKYE